MMTTIVRFYFEALRMAEPFRKNLSCQLICRLLVNENDNASDGHQKDYLISLSRVMKLVCNLKA
jgi:hypothetical protein